MPNYALPKTLFSPMNNVGTIPNTLLTFPSTLGTFPNTLRNFLSNKQDTLPNTLCCDFLKKSGLTPFPPFFQTCYKIYGWSRGGRGGVACSRAEKVVFNFNLRPYLGNIFLLYFTIFFYFMATSLSTY